MFEIILPFLSIVNRVAWALPPSLVPKRSSVGNLALALPVCTAEIRAPWSKLPPLSTPMKFIAPNSTVSIVVVFVPNTSLCDFLIVTPGLYNVSLLYSDIFIPACVYPPASAISRFSFGLVVPIPTLPPSATKIPLPPSS